MKYRFHIVVGILVTASLVLGCAAVAPTEVSPLLPRLPPRQSRRLSLLRLPLLMSHWTQLLPWPPILPKPAPLLLPPIPESWLRVASFI